MRLAYAIWVAAAFWGCGGGGAGGGDEAGDEVGPEAGDGEAGCDPGCHWDCFGGTTCFAGDVYILGGGPRSCCHYGDPWPGTGPMCTQDSPQYVCPTPACSTPDERYYECLSRVQYFSGVPTELLRLWCAEGAPHGPGDPCAVDQDCRPVADGAAPRLRCDSATSQCVSEARPLAPAGFGGSCGLTAADVPRASSDQAVPGVTCALCQVVADAAAGCLRQACTVPCHLDEDCPDGTVCLCALSGGLFSQYCAGATDRTTTAGRTAWLSCP